MYCVKQRRVSRFGKLNAVKQMKEPHNIKQLRVVLGLLGFYQKINEGFEKTAELLYKFLNKRKKIFLNEACKTDLIKPKKKLHQAFILGYPNDEDIYTITLDAS